MLAADDHPSENPMHAWAVARECTQRAECGKIDTISKFAMIATIESREV